MVAAVGDSNMEYAAVFYYVKCNISNPGAGVRIRALEEENND